MNKITEKNNIYTFLFNKKKITLLNDISLVIIRASLKLGKKLRVTVQVFEQTR